MAADSVRRGVRATTAMQVEYLVVGKLFDTDNLTHSRVVLLLGALLFDCLLLRETEKENKVPSACFLQILCLQFREQLARQVQAWGFECQGSFSPAFGFCNQKERMGKACLD